MARWFFSDFGRIVREEWIKSFEIRKELLLDEWQVMPNHLHAIVMISKAGYVRNSIKNNDFDEDVANQVDVQTHGCVSVLDLEETQGRVSVQDKINKEVSPSLQSQYFKETRLPKSISSFIAGFKSAVNSKIDDFIDEYSLNVPKYNRDNQFFQSNYHDRIIRDEKSYWAIKNYIRLNPQKWYEDELFL